MTEEKEINQLPKDWKWVKLGEVANYLNGRAFKPTEWKDEGKPIIRIQNLNKPSANYNYTKEQFEERYKVVKGDLLFAWSASLGAYIWKGDDAWLNQHIFKVVPKDFTDKRYLFYLLEKIVQELYAKAHGSGMVHVTKGKFEATDIPLPPKPTQLVIVSKIEELFSEIENGIKSLFTAKEQLKKYRQSVLKWAFEGKLSESGFTKLKDEQDSVNKKILQSSNSENPDSDKGKLPEGWKWVMLGEVIEKPKYGTSKKCDYASNGIGVLRIPNIVKGMVDSSDLKFAQFDAQEMETYGLKEGDILIIRSNGSVDIVGKCALVRKIDEQFLFAGYLIRLRAIQKLLLPKYLANIFSSVNIRNQIEEKAKSTSGVNNINSQELAGLIIPLPSIQQQQKIIEAIESRLSVADKMEESIAESLQQAESLKQSILKKAFEGRLI